MRRLPLPSVMSAALASLLLVVLSGTAAARQFDGSDEAPERPTVDEVAGTLDDRSLAEQGRMTEVATLKMLFARQLGSIDREGVEPSKVEEALRQRTIGIYRDAVDREAVEGEPEPPLSAPQQSEYDAMIAEVLGVPADGTPTGPTGGDEPPVGGDPRVAAEVQVAVPPGITAQNFTVIVKVSESTWNSVIRTDSSLSDQQKLAKLEGSILDLLKDASDDTIEESKLRPVASQLAAAIRAGQTIPVEPLAQPGGIPGEAWARIRQAIAAEVRRRLDRGDDLVDPSIMKSFDDEFALPKARELAGTPRISDEAERLVRQLVRQEIAGASFDRKVVNPIKPGGEDETLELPGDVRRVIVSILRKANQQLLGKGLSEAVRRQSLRFSLRDQVDVVLQLIERAVPGFTEAALVRKAILDDATAEILVSEALEAEGAAEDGGQRPTTVIITAPTTTSPTLLIPVQVTRPWCHLFKKGF